MSSPAAPIRPALAVAAFVVAALLVMASAAEAQQYPPGYGPQPVLPAPERSLVPTVNVAPVARWSAAGAPVPAAGFTVRAYARDLDHPRWVYVLPNGDVLVVESNAPPKPEDGKGIKGAIMKSQMKKAGAVTPSANRITLLRDIDANGVAKTRTVFLKNLHSPFGVALVGKELYVANTDAVVKFPYQEGQTEITAAPVKVMDLPGGPLNHHWTKNIIASPDGKYLYATVGSNSNVGENGMDKEEGRAAIWQLDLATNKAKLFATGLRNPNGMAWQPQSKALWTVVNERDELGNELVPDYLTSVKDGAFYGWPWSYWGQHVDTRVNPPNPDMVAKAIAPDFGLGSHVAPLGLAFSDVRMPGAYASGAFIGQHGSWNRKELTGYNVVFVPFADGRPSGPPPVSYTHLTLPTICSV